VHLASGLGSVEIFIAVHTVFDSPRDKIVLDTGHQGYPHKLLTGRYPVFHTLLCDGGYGSEANCHQADKGAEA